MAEQTPPLDEKEVRSLVAQHVQRMLGDLAGLGLTPDAIIRLVEVELKRELKRKE